MGATRAVFSGIRHGLKHRTTIAAIVKETQGPAIDYAKSTLEAHRQKRLAVTEAATLKDGTVLRMLRDETVVWVVFSGDQTVSVHPPVDVPLDELIAHVDLSQRRRPDDYPSAGQRAGRAGSAVAHTVTRRKKAKAETVELEPRPVDPKDHAVDPQDHAVDPQDNDTDHPEGA